MVTPIDTIQYHKKKKKSTNKYIVTTYVLDSTLVDDVGLAASVVNFRMTPSIRLSTSESVVSFLSTSM